MSIIAFTASTRRAIIGGAMAGLCPGAGVALLSGCGGGSSKEPVSVVTVTITPTVTGRSLGRPRVSPARRRVQPRSDVVGRKFDPGTIVRVQNDGGVPVRTAGRREGSRLLARRPRRCDPRALRCVLSGLQQPDHVPHPRRPRGDIHLPALCRHRQATGAAIFDFARVHRLRDPENVMLLSIDPMGQAVTVQNDPAC